MSNATQITTGKVRFSYLNWFRPRAFRDGDDPKYNVTLLIPKSDKATLAKINTAMNAAKKAWTDNGGKLPPNLKNTLHDGDETRPNGEEFGDECKGHYVITVSSKKQPVAVYADKTPITEENELDSGDYGRAIINFYVYDYNGTKGLSAGLSGLMKLHDGERLGGGGRVRDEDWDDGWEDSDDDLCG